MHDVHMGHIAIGKHHLVNLSGSAQCLQLGFVDDRHAIGVEPACEFRRVMAPGNPRDLCRRERDNFDRWIVAIDDVKVMKVAACSTQDHDPPPFCAALSRNRARRKPGSKKVRSRRAHRTPLGRACRQRAMQALAGRFAAGEHWAKGGQASLSEPSSGSTVRWSSTAVTPGADHAARSATSRSYQARTLPRSTTLPPSVWTVIPRASSSALRCKAFWIFSLTS